MLLSWDKIKQKQDDVDSTVIDALSFENIFLYDRVYEKRWKSSHAQEGFALKKANGFFYVLPFGI